MRVAARRLALALLVAIATVPAARAADPVTLVAAENVYGDIARQIGGSHAAVTSIISNADQDPHLFEPSPAVARQFTDARIVIFNGAHYDPWVEKLLKVAPRSKRIVINVSKVTGTKHGANPHLWYDPATMPKVASAVADALVKADPAHAADYKARLAATLASLKQVEARVQEMRTKYKGQPVAATEPVFGPMADALGLTMRNQRFQTAIMNETEPSARDIAAFEDDLKRRRVKVLIYNAQVSGNLTKRLIAIAKEAKVPVVAVTETQPASVSFTDWMLSQLSALDKALASPNS